MGGPEGGPGVGGVVVRGFRPLSKSMGLGKLPIEGMEGMEGRRVVPLSSGPELEG